MLSTAMFRSERGGSCVAIPRSQVKHTNKVRKPYTITKQRERWTDEEHELFLEALDKYGRAWRDIQEHVGTKTTVQIRSHAQKFFSKLEKEKRRQRAVAATDAQATSPKQRQKPRAHAAPELHSVSSHAAASVKSHSSAEHQQQSAADIAAAAGIVAAAAALQVIRSATEEVQAELQASPPRGFPFFGMAPSVLSALSCTDLQRAIPSTMSNGLQCLLPSAQVSGLQAKASGSRDSLKDSVALRLGTRGALLIAQDSERKATDADKAPEALAPLRALAHSPSGKGSSSLDQIISEPNSPPADSDSRGTLSAGTDTHSLGPVHSAGAVTQSNGGMTNDSSQACSSVQPSQGGKATAMAQLAEAAAAICSQEKALQAKQAGGGEMLPSMQAHAHMGGAAAPNYLPMFPAVPSVPLQQSMAAWGPYIALYQMQAMMAGPMGGSLGGGAGPPPEQVAAQQAQHAFMLAVHQMAHSQSPKALPQSLGIATGAASHCPSLPAALASSGVMPQDLSRATSLPLKRSVWPGTNPFDAPTPPFSISPSWLAGQGVQGGAAPPAEATPSLAL